MILGNPRSGSTLLMRLLNRVCLTPCVGDRPPEFYGGITNVWNHKRGTKPSYREDMWSNKWGDEYTSCYTKEAHDRQMRRAIREALFDSCWGGQHMKCMSLGFYNDGLVPFVGAMRDAFGESLKIVWLQRPPDEVAESYITSVGSWWYKKPEERHEIILHIEEQNDRIKEAAEFEDSFFTYQDVCKTPIKVLSHCEPRYDPIPSVVQKEMKIKLRDETS